jgi:outer membrane cobalamin receptor
VIRRFGGAPARLALPSSLLLLLVVAGLSLPVTSHGLDLPADPTPTAAAERMSLRVKGKRTMLPRGELDGTAPVVSATGAALAKEHLSLTQALDEQAGTSVRQTSGFGATAVLSVRGSSPDQVDTFLDGIPVLAVDGTPLDLADLPLGMVERLELYRGTSPALLGGQAIGGALRLQMRHERETTAEVALGAGSYGARSAEAWGTWAGESVGVSGGVRWLQADGDFGYLDQRGTAWDASDDRWQVRRNNDVARLAGTLAADWHPTPRWQFEGRWLGSLLDQGVPGVALYPAEQARLGVGRQLGYVAATGLGVAAKGDRLRATVQASVLNTEVDDRLGELGPPWHTQQQVAGLGALTTYESARWGPVGVQGRIGLQHGTVETTELRTNTTQPGSNRTTLGLGLAAPVVLAGETLEIVPSAGLDLQHSQRMTNQGFPFTWREIPVEDGQLWTGRLGVGWRMLPWLRVTAAGTRGTRAPTLVELFGNDGVIRGNVQLRPEAALGLDAAVQAEADRGEWGAAASVGAFASAVNDLIQLQVLGPHQAAYQNVDHATLRGGEAVVRLRAPHGLKLTTQHTTIATENGSITPAYHGKPLPLRPRTRWGVRGAWTRQVGAVQGSLWSGLQWQAGHFADAAGLVVVPSRTTLAGGIRVDLPRHGFFLDVRADNALDSAHFDLLGYPLPGRTFFVSLGWRGGPDTP